MRHAPFHMVIALVVGVMVMASFSYGFFSGIEHFFEDLFFSPGRIDPEIVIVAIDNESLARLGQWPWPRERFADFLTLLKDHPPKAVGIDVMFAEPSRLGRGDDESLAASLGKIPFPVVFPVEAFPLELTESGYKARGLVETLSIFRAPAVGYGHVNVLVDKDGVARRFPVSFLRGDGGEGTSVGAFAHEVLAHAGRNIPDEGPTGRALRIVYAGPPGAVRRIPFWRVFEDDMATSLGGKIVLVGVTAPDLHDEAITPFSRGNAMPGVEIQANIVNMLGAGQRLREVPRVAMYAWLLFSAMLPALFFIMFPRSLKPVGVSLGFGALYLIAAAALFDQGWVVNMVHLTFGWVLSSVALLGYRYAAVERERREMRHLFGKYVSREVLEEILRDPTGVALGGEEREVTVFFSDIRGFTTISEKTAPRDLVRLLNIYFSEMSREVLIHGGVLDKYIGDAIMAFWGAPLDDAHHADHAFDAARAMIEKLGALNKRLQEMGGPEINIGIGLYTGPAVVGNIGSEERHDYTIIGDTVNVASRLEGLTKEFKTRLVIGETTRLKITRDAPFRHLGAVTVKGRGEPLEVYTVAGCEWE